jgi:hypothetical protein
VLPPEAVNETDPQAVDVPEMEAVGTVFTVIACDAVAVHPSEEVTVTVYVSDEVKVLAAVEVLFPPLHE